MEKILNMAEIVMEKALGPIDDREKHIALPQTSWGGGAHSGCGYLPPRF